MSGMQFDKKWSIKKAKVEDGQEIAAGFLALDHLPPYPRRCTSGIGDPQNHECMWCGAPLDGLCQDPYP